MRNKPGRVRSLAVVLAGVALAGVAAAAGSGSKGQTYRWVDKDGVVHFGDHIPAEANNTERQVLNDYGVPIATVQGAKTAEQIAAEQAAAKKAADEKRQAELAARRDQVLLDTYLSVDEIQELRDRRLELINAQIQVTENHLQGLQMMLQKLQSEASAFKPYSNDPNAAPIDDKLARDLATTMDSILLYEKNLATSNARKTDVIGQFASDIDRFRELKGATAPR